jgi:mannose-1-phosphate guanylyltransferase/mannose-6-phosphate isomerase
LELAAGRSLLDATLARARRFAGKDRVWVVCGSEHARALRRATGLPAPRVLVEPLRRNTAMAVALAAERIAAQDPDAVLAVLPADHLIPDARAFAAAMRLAAKAARGAEVLVTLGVKPTRAETGYGYIQVGPAAGGLHPGLHRVRRFVEKPDATRARRYLRRGGYLWNAGIFVWTARTILQEVEACAPELGPALATLRRGETGRKRGRSAPALRIHPEALRAAYRRAPSLPIDVAVLERSRRVWTLPVEFHWSDVGTWESLAEELGVGPGRSRVVAGDLAFDDTGGNLVWGQRRAIALVGVEGLAVIDDGDALLVARLDRASELRRVVAELKAGGREDLT